MSSATQALSLVRANVPFVKPYASITARSLSWWAFRSSGGHGGLVVEVGQGAVGIEGPGVQNGLGGLLNFGLLCIGGGGPREIVVNIGDSNTIITF